MRTVKKMLLGIGFLIVSSIGMTIWLAGSAVGVVTFFAALVLGIFFLVDGYLSVDD